MDDYYLQSKRFMRPMGKMKPMPNIPLACLPVGLLVIGFDYPIGLYSLPMVQWLGDNL